MPLAFWDGLSLSKFEAWERTGLVGLGLLTCRVEESLAMHHERASYMHATGHWLGMDVHDVGDYRVDGHSRLLEPGMVLSVEPGLYVAPAREAVSFRLQEYHEVAIRERRDRLGLAVASQLEREEQAYAPKITHPIPPELSGLGMRREDDVLITAGGNEVLTSSAPKTIDAIERVCAEASPFPR